MLQRMLPGSAFEIWEFERLSLWVCSLGWEGRVEFLLPERPGSVSVLGVKLL